MRFFMVALVPVMMMTLMILLYDSASLFLHLVANTIGTSTTIEEQHPCNPKKYRFSHHIMYHHLQYNDSYRKSQCQSTDSNTTCNPVTLAPRLFRSGASIATNVCRASLPPLRRAHCVIPHRCLILDCTIGAGIVAIKILTIITCGHADTQIKVGDVEARTFQRRTMRRAFNAEVIIRITDHHLSCLVLVFTTAHTLRVFEGFMLRKSYLAIIEPEEHGIFVYGSL